MAFEDYHSSRTTLERLESTFKNGYLSVLNLIADSPDFFNGDISGEELFKEFVLEPIEKIKELERKKRNTTKNSDSTLEDPELQISKNCKKNPTNCHALIHLKNELRQCQGSQLPDDDFCRHHSKLDVLPYGRITFD